MAEETCVIVVVIGKCKDRFVKREHFKLAQIVTQKLSINKI